MSRWKNTTEDTYPCYWYGKKLTASTRISVTTRDITWKSVLFWSFPWHCCHFVVSSWGIIYSTLFFQVPDFLRKLFTPFFFLFLFCLLFWFGSVFCSNTTKLFFCHFTTETKQLLRGMPWLWRFSHRSAMMCKIFKTFLQNKLKKKKRTQPVFALNRFKWLLVLRFTFCHFTCREPVFTRDFSSWFFSNMHLVLIFECHT